MSWSRAALLAAGLLLVSGMVELRAQSPAAGKPAPALLDPTALKTRRQADTAALAPTPAGAPETVVKPKVPPKRKTAAMPQGDRRPAVTKPPKKPRPPA